MSRDTDPSNARRRARARARHAAAQRSYAATQKARGIPRSDDLGRALLAALRARFAGPASERLSSAEQEKWRDLIEAAVDQLAARGFDRRRARHRLVRFLMPPRSGP